MLNQEETEVLIEQLIEVIEERKIGYQKASEKIKDPYLKELFRANAIHSELLNKDLLQFSENWDKHLNENGRGEWRYWKEMRAALKVSSRNDLLTACIKGEQKSVDLFQEMINDPHLPQEIRKIIINPYNEIKKTIDLLNIFKICL